MHGNPTSDLAPAVPDAASLTVRNSLQPLDTTVEASACADCLAPIHGAYCAQCGQHRVEPPREFWPLMREWFSAYFNLEGKLLVSLHVLMRQPGELSLEYFRGRRTRYFPPLKLYLTLSVLFFTLAAIKQQVLPNKRTQEASAKAEAREALLLQIQNDSVDVDEAIEEALPPGSDDNSPWASKRLERLGLVLARAQRRVATMKLAALDSNRGLTAEEKAQAAALFEAARSEASLLAKEVPLGLSAAAALIIEKAAAAQEEALSEDIVPTTPSQRAESFIGELATTSPRALFFFLPLFAGVYAFLFRKQSFYVECFVFTLHLHAFFLALGMIDLLLPGVWSTLVMFVGMAVYSVTAMQRVFELRRGRAAWFTFCAMSGYFVIFLMLQGLTNQAGLFACVLGGTCS